MKKLGIAVLTAGALTFTLTGAEQCSKGKPSTCKVDLSKALAQAKKGAAVNPWAFLPPVVAEVNGKKITKQQFVDFFKASLPGGKLPPMITPEMLKKVAPRIIKQYVERDIFLQAAAKAGFKPSKKLAENNFKDALKEAGAQERERIKRQLAMSNMTIDKFIAQNAEKKSVQENAAIDAWLKKKALSKITVSPKEVKDFYLKNKEKFVVPGDPKGAIRASHILVKFGNAKGKAPSAQEEKAARTKCKAILARLKKGESFEKIAQAESACPSGKMNNGSLGAFKKEQMVKPFSDAALKLKPGQISGLVKTQFGYHIIRRDAPQGATEKKFDEVKDMIGKVIKARKASQKVKEITDNLMAENKVKIMVK